MIPRVLLCVSAFLLHLRQLFHQRQHHFHYLAAAVFYASRQRAVEILLIINLHAMPAGAVREGAGFLALLIAILLPSDQLVASTDSTGIPALSKTLASLQQAVPFGNSGFSLDWSLRQSLYCGR